VLEDEGVLAGDCARVAQQSRHDRSLACDCCKAEEWNKKEQEDVGFHWAIGAEREAT